MDTVLFVSNRVRSDVVGMLVAFALVVSGVLAVPEALVGFSEPVIILVVAMFVVSEALASTGIAPKMGERLIAMGRGSKIRINLQSVPCTLVTNLFKEVIT